MKYFLTLLYEFTYKDDMFGVTIYEKVFDYVNSFIYFNFLWDVRIF